MASMYIDIVPNRRSPPAILLRESIREGGRVRKRTIANLSALPIEQAEMIRRVLKGEKLGPLESALEVVCSQHHGQVAAVLTAMRRLGFDKLLEAKPSRERDLVVAMVAGRIIAPEASKLAMTRAWADTTLADELGVAYADEDCLYAAMDWLIERQEAIEKRLAKRHLRAGGLVLFDLTSSYFEGVTCPLAKLGFSRDGKAGTLQVNWGLMTDDRGCPVAVSVFDGNTGDPKDVDAASRESRLSRSARSARKPRLTARVADVSAPAFKSKGEDGPAPNCTGTTHLNPAHDHREPTLGPAEDSGGTIPARVQSLRQNGRQVHASSTLSRTVVTLALIPEVARVDRLGV